MSKISRFQDLIAWQKARSLTKSVYAITRQNDFARDYGLTGQIQRAAVSIMSNIAEGFERSSLREFHRFLSTAKSSCDEVRSQLYVPKDIGYLTDDSFRRIMLQAQEVGKIVSGLKISVQNKLKVQTNAKRSKR